jgi:hypothetical protein
VSQNRAALHEFANDRLVLGEPRLAMAAEIRRLETSRRMKTLHQLDDETVTTPSAGMNGGNAARRYAGFVPDCAVERA